jgi:hypothetical protein
MGYQEALERTDPRRIQSVTKGSPEEKAATGRFVDFISRLSEENIRAKTRKVYAVDAYLNDTLKESIGIDRIEAYFVETARAAEEITARVEDVAESGGNYYFRWTMNVRFKKFKKGETVRSIGMSHIRFNSAGQVVLHQDYWDSGGNLFEHIPVVGWLIRRIKARL